MAAKIDTLADEAARTVRWCEQHVDSLDPLHRPLTMPPIRQPTRDGYTFLLRQIMTELADRPGHQP